VGFGSVSQAKSFGGGMIAFYHEAQSTRHTCSTAVSVSSATGALQQVVQLLVCLMREWYLNGKFLGCCDTRRAQKQIAESGASLPVETRTHSMIPVSILLSGLRHWHKRPPIHFCVYLVYRVLRRCFQ